MKETPVLIVEDDIDDQEFFKEAWDQLEYPNPLKFFKKPEEVLQYLKQEKVVPFLIISDVNLPKMDGFELKKKLLEDSSVNHRTIPFVFFSESASNEQIIKSYDLGSHGFFIKGNIKELKSTLASIVEYWQNSKTPE
jgi:CheY-like chemotaxis protein